MNTATTLVKYVPVESKGSQIAQTNWISENSKDFLRDLLHFFCLGVPLGWHYFL